MSVRMLRTFAVALATLGLVTLALTATSERASAATPPVGLGTAGGYAVLAGSTITNTGASVLTGDVGLSPGTDVTGFPPGLINGATHVADAEAVQAKIDLTVAYGDAAGRTPASSVAAELGGQTFMPGVYVGQTLELTGSMTLDAGGDPDAVFVFQTNSTLITAGNSSVNLIGGANLCNVYWQVSSSATLGTGTDFVGTVMAQESITANSGATVQGRLLALNGAVTLDDNVIDRPICPDLPPGTTTTTTEPDASTTTEPGASTTTEPVSTSTTEPGGSTTTEPVSASTTEPGVSTTTGPSQGSTTTSSTPGSGSPTTGPGTPGGPGGPGTPGGPGGPGTPGGPGGPGGPGTPGGPGGPRGPGGPGTPPTSLVNTGSNPGPLVAIGLLTLAAGAGTLAMRRQRLAR